MTNKDLIKQKISEALSASLGGEIIDYNSPPKHCNCTPSSVAHLRGCWEGWGYIPKDWEVEFDSFLDGELKSDFAPWVSPQRIKEFIRKEKEKRESEIKSALETIDWSFLDAGENGWLSACCMAMIEYHANSKIYACTKCGQECGLAPKPEGEYSLCLRHRGIMVNYSYPCICPDKKETKLPLP